MEPSETQMAASGDELSERSQESASAYPADWSTFGRSLTVVVLLVAAVAAATLIGPVLQFVVLAAILVFILAFPTRMVERRLKISHGLAVGLVFLTYLALAVVLLLFLAIPAIEGLSRLGADLSRELPGLLDFLKTYTPGQGWLLDPDTGERLANINFILEPLSQMVKGEDAEGVSAIISGLASLLPDLVATVGEIVTGAIVVNVLAFFFLLELPALYGGVIGRIQPPHRREYQLMTGHVILVWVNFFRGTVVSAAIIASLTYIQLLIMGIPAALTLSLLVFVTSLIPLVGGLIALPVLIFVTFTQGSTTLDLEPIPLTIAVVLVHALVSQFVWNVVYPKLAGRAIKLPVSLVLVGLAVGAAIGGFLGVLLAAPVLGTVRQIAEFLLSKVRGGDPYPGEPDPGWEG